MSSLSVVTSTSRRFLNSVIVALAGILASMLVGSVMIAVEGHSPLEALQVLGRGALGSPEAFGAALNRATPLLFVAVGFIFAYKAGLINIGLEGQIYVGGAAAAATALGLQGSSRPLVVIIASFLAAGAAGAAWAGLSGLMKATRGVSEIISTFLMNFVAFQLVSYLLSTPHLLQDPKGGRLQQSQLIAESARLPTLFGLQRLHLGFVVAVGIAIAVWLLFRWTTLGFRIRLVGHSAESARLAGLPVATTVVLAMAGSGALGGLAGASLVLGDQYRILTGLSSGFGFDGIVVALLAFSSPIGAIPAAVLLGALGTGGEFMEAALQIPSALVSLMQGVIVFALVLAIYLSGRLKSIGLLRE